MCRWLEFWRVLFRAVGGGGNCVYGKGADGVIFEGEESLNKFLATSLD